MNKKVITLLLLTLFVIILYFLFYPVPFDPVSFTPPKKPGLQHSFQKNEKLQASSYLLDGYGPKYGMIIGIESNGNITHNYQNSEGHIHKITSVLEINNTLYLGSLTMDKITVINL